MEGEETGGPDLDEVAASLRADASDINVFFQVFCQKLADTMGGAVTLEREGGFFKKEHPVKGVTVTLGEDVFSAELSHGVVAAHRAHAVRGITLKSEDMDFHAWLEAIVQVLGQQAQASSQARAALQSLVT